MAKGSLAKENVIKVLANAFGKEFIGEFDKKIYVLADDGGEQVQIAISLTCPKNPIQIDESTAIDDGDWDFSDNPPVKTAVPVASAGPAEITEEEKANISTLLLRLGL